MPFLLLLFCIFFRFRCDLFSNLHLRQTTFVKFDCLDADIHQRFVLLIGSHLRYSVNHIEAADRLSEDSVCTVKLSTGISVLHNVELRAG